MITTTLEENEGIATSGGGAGGVDSRVREGKGPVVVLATTIGISVAVAGKTTLNSLTTRVILENIALLDSGAK